MESYLHLSFSLAMDKMLRLESLEISRMEILPSVDIHCCVFPIATGSMNRGVSNEIELVFGLICLICLTIKTGVF